MFDLDRAARALRERRRRNREQAGIHRRELERFVPVLVEAFRGLDPDIERIVLFGSLAKDAPAARDIDVAVSSRRYFKLVGWALDAPHKIDVVDLDSAQPEILAAIGRTGKILYEKR